MTLSAWQSHDQMKAFRNSGAHLQAMKDLNQVATDARSCTFECDTFPTWDEALKQTGWDH